MEASEERAVFRAGQQLINMSHLLGCSLRQEPLPLRARHVEVGATHSRIAADAHPRPGEAAVLTEAALLPPPETEYKECS